MGVWFSHRAVGKADGAALARGVCLVERGPIQAEPQVCAQRPVARRACACGAADLLHLCVVQVGGDVALGGVCRFGLDEPIVAPGTWGKGHGKGEREGQEEEGEIFNEGPEGEGTWLLRRGRRGLPLYYLACHGWQLVLPWHCLPLEA